MNKAGRPGLLIFLLMFLAVSAAVYSQTGLSLNAEINNIEISLSRQGITETERHSALVSLARLRQLSGDIEGAARNWLEAAAAISGSVDDNALLNCAFCLAAMGEWDRASAALEPLLLRYKRARFLYISINAIKTGNVSELGNLAGNPEYSDIKSEIIFILWKLTGSASWKQRLITEFPNTPEGRLAMGNADISSGSVAINPTPFWFLINSLETTVLTTGEPHISSTGSYTGNASQTQTSASSVRLQTGL